MKAAVCRAFGAPLEIEDVTLCAPEPNELVVDIKAVAICHSDMIFADGGWGGDLPAIYGHEAAGVVSVAGAQSGYAAGARVIVTMVRSCGSCMCCDRGLFGACLQDYPRDRAPLIADAKGAPVARMLKTGAFAQQALVTPSQVAALPDDVSFDVGALIACGVITGYGAVVNTAKLRSGAKVGVIGAGGVGINCLQAAGLRDPELLVAIDLVDDKLALASRLGATHTINPGTQDTSAAVADLTGGTLLDAVFVAAGNRAAIEAAFPLIGPAGVVVLAGIPPSGVEATIDPVTLASWAQTVLGSKMHADLGTDIPAIIDHYRAGRLKLDDLIAARVPFERINDAMDAARAGASMRHVVQIGDPT